jgi:hypothetical protein
MHIVKKTPDLLVVHSPASKLRTVLRVGIALGAMLGMMAGVCLIVGVALLFMEQPDSDAFLGAVVIGVFAALFAVGSWFGLRAAKDKYFHFDGKSETLHVRWRGGEDIIPFARIIRAEVFDDGDDNVAYALRLKLREPDATVTMSIWREQEDYHLKELADTINRFLDHFRPPSIDLAESDVLTMAHQFLNNVLYGAPKDIPAAHTAPAVRDGPVLFVCPKCGEHTNDPRGSPPYECGRCSTLYEPVHLQDRTPGRTVVVACRCGASFSVPVSFTGMKRPCPECGRKCKVTPPPPPAPAPKPVDTNIRETEL